MKASSRRLLWWLGLMTLFVTGCTGTPPERDQDQDQDWLTPVSGAIDPRSYRYLELDNGLRVLLISDPRADRAAASLSVGVGSEADPEGMEGLAHFLEHMLFLGTDQYPDPAEYNEFIGRHGGRHNAYTAQDHTNYFFEIAADEFRGALDRFSRFFVAPLFNEEYVQREINAVHSEYQMQTREDGWRIFMTQKQAMHPEHPAARFNIGSLDTLRDREDQSLREALLEFYARHYSADRMGLVLLGREDPDTLRQWAQELFAEVPARDTHSTEPEVPLFGEDRLPALLEIEPVRELRQLQFSFPLPPLPPHYREAPGDFLADLVGHEGEGSLHAYLTEQGWIEGLIAGASRFGDHHGMFTVRINLTEAGLEHWQDIGQALFAYLQRVRSDAISADRFEEFRQLTALRFDYREPGAPMGYARGLSHQLLLYPPVDVVRGRYAVKQFDADLIQQFLRRLQPDNALVTLVAPEVDTDAVEPWFEVPYRLQPLENSLVARWQQPAALEALALPGPNPFLPERLDLIDSHADTPARLQSGAGVEAWHLPDTEFGAPRAAVRLQLDTPLAAASPADRVLTTLYARLVNDALNTRTYPAYLAGLDARVSAGSTGLNLTVGGFDDKLDELLDVVLDEMLTLSVDPDRFQRFRAEVVRELRNSLQERPYQRTMGELRRLLERPAFATQALIAAAEQLTPADLEQWLDHAFDAPGATLFLHGNLETERAAAMLARVERQFTGGATADTLPVRQLARLTAPPVQMPVSAEHSDAAISLYVQGRDQSWTERARFGLLAHMISTPYFNDLRTDRQLGYLVSAGPWVRVNTPGIFFVVQSHVAPPRAIETLTLEFLQQYRERLAQMTEAEYQAERQGLLARLLERDQNLDARGSRLWNDLRDEIRSFDSREQIAEALQALSLDEFRAFVDDFLEHAQTHRVATWTTGRFTPADAAPSGVEIIDPEVFLETRRFFTLDRDTQPD